MRIPSQIWFVAPHLLSSACFAAAFLWMSVVETNRSAPDMYLGIGGFSALALALVSSIAAGVIVFRRRVRRGWLWLVAHLGGLAVALALANDWLAAHIA